MVVQDVHRKENATPRCEGWHIKREYGAVYFRDMTLAASRLRSSTTFA